MSTNRRTPYQGVPLPDTLDLFDFASQPSINRSPIFELTGGEHVDQHENILFLGSPGTGNNHLTTALGHVACALVKCARFFPMIELVNQLLEAREEWQLQRLRRRLDDNHLLVLDEFG